MFGLLRWKSKKKKYLPRNIPISRYLNVEKFEILNIHRHENVPKSIWIKMHELHSRT